MSTRSSSWASACAVSALLACALSASCAGALEDGDRFALLDAGGDAGMADAGGDGGVDIKDGGVSDAGVSDAGGLDAGNVDAGCNALTTVIAPTCATALCHSSGTQQGSLDLQSPGLPYRLVNVPAAGGPGLLIDPNHPESSVLYLKVLSPPPYGAQMPLLGQALDAQQVACLKSWIHAAVGAP